jgi:hypothetical protein
MINTQVVEKVTSATPAAKRKPGRPGKFAPWFAAVAKTMGNGTSLRNALMWNRIQVSEREIKNLYKNVEFRRLYKLARHMFMYTEYGKRPQSELEAIRKNFERTLR